MEKTKYTVQFLYPRAYWEIIQYSDTFLEYMHMENNVYACMQYGSFFFFFISMNACVIVVTVILARAQLNIRHIRL